MRMQATARTPRLKSAVRWIDMGANPQQSRLMLTPLEKCESWRLLRRLQIDTTDGVVRLSFCPYNTKEDTQRLIEALTSILG